MADSTRGKRQMYSLLGIAISQLPTYLVRELNKQHGEVTCEPLSSSTIAFGVDVSQLPCSSLQAPSDGWPRWSPEVGLISWCWWRCRSKWWVSKRGVEGSQVSGFSKPVYQCQRSTSTWQDHTCLSLHLTVCISYTKITMPVHPREGFKKTKQISRWWALPFPLTRTSWQRQLLAGLGHWKVFCFVCFLCYYCVSVN